MATKIKQKKEGINKGKGILNMKHFIKVFFCVMTVLGSIFLFSSMLSVQAAF
jgi:hypothetical protein